MTHKAIDIKKVFLLVLVMLLLLGCGGLAATPVSDDNAVASMVASTLQAYQSPVIPTLAASPTAIVSSPIPPTVVPAATFTSTPPVPQVVRINFLSGTTQTVITGQVKPGQTLGYVVQASEDQPVIAMLDSTNQDAKLSIRGQNGTALLPLSAGFSNWQGLIPTTQDYFIDITGGTVTENFTFNLTIVARVKFAAGETRTVLRGVTLGGFAVSYVVHALEGQKMDVLLNVPTDTAALTIWGFDDGQPYVRSQSGTVDFSLNLPSTQDYIIEVVPKAGGTVEYNMSVRIK
jgi:hypothetical protein